jgi:hypothetical protein
MVGLNTHRQKHQVEKPGQNTPQDKVNGDSISTSNDEDNRKMT